MDPRATLHGETGAKEQKAGDAERGRRRRGDQKERFSQNSAIAPGLQSSVKLNAINLDEYCADGDRPSRHETGAAGRIPLWRDGGEAAAASVCSEGNVSLQCGYHGQT